MGWLDDLIDVITGGGGGGGGEAPPLAPPVFTVGPRTYGITMTAIGVEWQTDIKTNALLRVKESATDGPWLEIADESRATNHRHGIQGLRPSTSYDVIVRAFRKSRPDVVSEATLTAMTLGQQPGPAPGPAPTPIGDLPHQTDFLSAGVRTHPYAGYAPADRQRVLKAMLDRHYTHLYVYAYNEKDYGGPAFDGYANPDAFRAMLQEIVAAGLRPVLWCFPDDAPKLHAESEAQLKDRLSRLIPRVDDLVTSYVLGLELNEYWPGARVNALGSYLNGLTQKQIATHQTSGNYNFASYGWVDYCVYQYAKRQSASEIASETKAVIAAVRKPVVAGEYEVNNEAIAVPLGDAAVRAGASGFGNGGTAFATEPPPTEPPAGGDPIPHPAGAINLLTTSPRSPWVPGALTQIDALWENWLLRWCLGAKTHLIISDMTRIPDVMRGAGFRGRNNALWYTLSRSYAGWNWSLKPGDPDAHLSNQRGELRDFWKHYLAAIIRAMQRAPETTATIILNDAKDHCGRTLGKYSEAQMKPVASRVQMGDTVQD